ncbi:arsenate reductase family protein [Rhodobaculum claviforme]|uniref:arsenate reductase family protein n=1 Tax=Rhodobaculum claviforme TaxID=1549854 RepID=UPI00308469FC
MSITLYGIPTCDTCRKARRALEAAGHTVAFRDVRAAPLTAAEWAEMVAALGDGVVNRRAPSFRALEPSVQDAAPADLLAAAPVVMKRPVIRAGDAWHLGWGAPVQAALL